MEMEPIYTDTDFKTTPPKKRPGFEVRNQAARTRRREGEILSCIKQVPAAATDGGRMH